MNMSKKTSKTYKIKKLHIKNTSDTIILIKQYIIFSLQYIIYKVIIYQFYISAILCENILIRRLHADADN